MLRGGAFPLPYRGSHRVEMPASRVFFTSMSRWLRLPQYFSSRLRWASRKGPSTSTSVSGAGPCGSGRPPGAAAPGCSRCSTIRSGPGRGPAGPAPRRVRAAPWGRPRRGSARPAGDWPASAPRWHPCPPYGPRQSRGSRGLWQPGQWWEHPWVNTV